MVKSRFLQITSILMIVFSAIMIFFSLVFFIIAMVSSLATSHATYYFSSYSYHSSSSMSIMFNLAAAISGSVINIIAAIVGICGGAYGLKNWKVQEKAGKNMIFAISSIIITVIGFVLLAVGVLPLIPFLFVWFIFQMVAPVLHLIGAYTMKQGKPISTSTNYGYTQYNNYNGYYNPNEGYNNNGYYPPNGYENNGYNGGYNPNPNYGNGENQNYNYSNANYTQSNSEPNEGYPNNNSTDNQ